MHVCVYLYSYTHNQIFNMLFKIYNCSVYLYKNKTFVISHEDS